MLWRPKTLKTGKLARRKRHTFFLKVTAIFLLTLTLFTGIVYLLNRPEFLITKVVVSGTSTLSQEELKQFAEKEIGGKYLFVVDKSNIFLYPRRTLLAQIPRTFKKVRSVDIQRREWSVLSIHIEEREPSALWCGENRLEGVTPECYFIDENGFIYAQAPVFSDNVYTRFYGSLVNGRPIGQSLFKSDRYRSLLLFLLSLKDDDIDVSDFAVRDENDIEMHLKDGIEVLFGRKQELSTVLNNLHSVFLSDEFKDIDPSDRKSVV